MSRIDELCNRKSTLLLDVEQAKATRRSKVVRRLASEAAAIERSIAYILLSEGLEDEALINLVSAGSCFVDAGRDVEARRAFELALPLAATERLQGFILEQLQSVKSQLRPGSVFAEVPISIRGNDLLRRPQIEAYEAVHRHFSNSSAHAIIQLPVGCGKTGTMALLPFGLSRGRTLVVAPNLEIARTLHVSLNYSSPDSFLRKTRSLSNGRGPTCAVLDADANVLDPDSSDFVLANVQQLVASQGEKWLGACP